MFIATRQQKNLRSSCMLVQFHSFNSIQSMYIVHHDIWVCLQKRKYGCFNDEKPQDLERFIGSPSYSDKPRLEVFPIICRVLEGFPHNLSWVKPTSFEVFPTSSEVFQAFQPCFRSRMTSPAAFSQPREAPSAWVLAWRAAQTTSAAASTASPGSKSLGDHQRISQWNMYIYIYIHICVYVHIYIYIYISIH